jgi:hypothetical protein
MVDLARPDGQRQAYDAPWLYPVAMEYSNGNNCCEKNFIVLKMVFLVQFGILFGFS